MKREIKIRTYFKNVNICVDGNKICHNFSFYGLTKLVNVCNVFDRLDVTQQISSYTKQ